MNLEPVPTLADRYVYSAELVRVIDGDSVILDLDLGCGMWLRGERCRLIGIDAPEKRGDDKLAGFKAMVHMESLLEDVSPLIVRTHKDSKGKFGRWLVELWTTDGVNLNQRMITDGHATEYDRG